MKTMCKTRGGHTSERDQIGKKQKYMFINSGIYSRV